MKTHIRQRQLRGLVLHHHRHPADTSQAPGEPNGQLERAAGEWRLRLVL